MKEMQTNCQFNIICCCFLFCRLSWHNFSLHQIVDVCSCPHSIFARPWVNKLQPSRLVQCQEEDISYVYFLLLFFSLSHSLSLLVWFYDAVVTFYIALKNKLPTRVLATNVLAQKSLSFKNAITVCAHQS